MNIDLDNRIIVNFLEAFLFKGDIASACNTLRGQDLAPKSSIDVEFIILSFVKDKHEKAKSMHQIAKDNITLRKYNAARNWCKKALSQSDNAELTAQINNSLKAIENELAPQKN